MILKKDVKQGEILPIYTNPQTCEGLIGVGELISRSKNDDQDFFYLTEKQLGKANKSFKIKDIVYHQNAKGIWTKARVRQITDTYMLINSITSSKYIRVYYPYPNLRSSYEEGQEIVCNGVAYVITKDNPENIHAVTQKFWAEEMDGLTPSSVIGNNETIFTKPIECEEVGNDPQSFVWKNERWVVNIFGNPFFSELSVGQSVYYKDLGQWVIVSKDKGILLKHPEDDSRIVKADTKDMFVPHRISHSKVAKISCYCGTGSRHYDRIKRDKSFFDVEEWDD